MSVRSVCSWDKRDTGHDPSHHTSMSNNETDPVALNSTSPPGKKKKASSFTATWNQALTLYFTHVTSPFPVAGLLVDESALDLSCDVFFFCCSLQRAPPNLDRPID